MRQLTRRTILAAAPGALALALPLLSVRPARAKEYGPGVTDTEIKIGNTVPYSGPASSYGTIGKAQAAYYKMINEKGGINGRKINFISYDDAYTPPKTVEQVRKLVEQDEVLFDRKPARHPDQQRDLAIHEPEEGAAAVRRHRRDQVERPEGPSLDDGLAAQLPERGPHLRGLHPAEQARRQDRRALPERRFRQGLPEGAEGRARRQGRRWSSGRGALRNDRPDRRFADRRHEGRGRAMSSSIRGIPKFAAQAIRKAAKSSGSRCTSSAASATRSAPR